MASAVPTSGRSKVVNSLERAVPLVQINIDGESIIDKELNDVLERVHIIRSDRGLSEVEVKFQDEFNVYQSGKSFKINQPMTIFAGYQSQSVVPIGKFDIRKNNYSSSVQNDTITLVGYDKASLLMDDEDSNIYKNKKDSEIAKQIAEQHNLDHEIDDTEERLSSITRSNETLAQFLKRRSKLYGYQFFVEQDILYFRRPKIEDSDVVVTFGIENIDGEEVQPGMQQFSFTVDNLEKGQQAEYRGIDIDKKESFKVKGQVRDDSPQNKLVEQENAGVVDFNDLKAKEAKNFLFDEDQEIIKGPMKKVVDAITESRSWLVTGEFKSTGIHDVRPGQTMSIRGVGRYSGKYYVKKLRHVIDSDGFQSIVTVARSHLLEASSDFQSGRSNNPEPTKINVNEEVNVNNG